jgi:hypothetical protein
MSALSKADILRLFHLLDAELATADVVGEVHLVGGAVMCLAFDARESTAGVDALFAPKTVIRAAARRVALRANASPDWLNDTVKGCLGDKGEFEVFLELDHLRVFVARPEYLLAMKCVALRLGEEFHDVDDVRYLLRYLNIATAEEALRIITRYLDEARLLPKTRLALQEILR